MKKIIMSYVIILGMSSNVWCEPRAFFSPDDNVAQVMIDYIDQEKEQIDCAIFTLTHTGIIDAFIKAAKRKVHVNIVIDQNSLGSKSREEKFDAMIAAGVNLYLFNPKKFYYAGSGNAQLFYTSEQFLSGYDSYQPGKKFTKDEQQGLLIPPIMHHKVCIFYKNKDNKSITWTGSYNYTYSATDHNQENALVIDDTHVADAFKKQFNVIKTYRSEPLKQYVAQPHEGKTTYEVYFAPDQDVAARLIELIDHEQEKISVAIYDIAHPGIIDAFVRAHKRGVTIEAVLDHGNKEALAGAGIPVYLFDHKKFAAHTKRKELEHEESTPEYVIMHNKFCIFYCNENNKQLLWTGSFNYTYPSNLTFQNNGIVLNAHAIIDQYQQQFELIKKHRTDIYQPSYIASIGHWIKSFF